MRFSFLPIVTVLISLAPGFAAAGAQPTTPQFRDGVEEACVSCHPAAVQAWRTSDHERAMQHASAATVLGNFDDTTLSHSGEQTRLSRTGDTFHAEVSTGAQPEASEAFQVLYTFGIHPLQQYLVETGNGKLQALPWAWDTRPVADGGQRWFHLYEDEEVPRGDRLHWQSNLQNWNGMCADCHSTGLARGYSLSDDTFTTKATSLNVSCASCHGEASGHVTAMQSGQTGKKISSADFKDIIRFLDASTSRFESTDGEPTATNTGASHKGQEIEACAACHSRRTPLTRAIDPARAFLDQFTPELLEDGLYHADGQIRDEVYVWGSFIQSKMAAAGVTCSNCHNAHSLKLKAEGNALCTACHAPAVFDTGDHHRHKASSGASQCTNCHMPQTTYMGVDARRDHGFKIPRPDVSAKIGTPNACTGCHKDMSNETAAQHIETWHGPERAPSFAKTFHDARNRAPEARAPLARLIEDEAEPAIVRATALGLVGGLANAKLLDLATANLTSTEPLLRLGAIRALSLLPPEPRASLLGSLLDDEIKAVRLEAAMALVDVSPTAMTSETAVLLGVVTKELLLANEQVAWRGEGRLNRGLIYRGRGDLVAAETAWREATLFDPSFAPAWVNLSELLRASGKQDEAMAVLTHALEATSRAPSVHHALGLALIRQNRHAEALAHLEKAADGAPHSARFAYVHVVALNSLGGEAEAVTRLSAALTLHANDPDLLNLALSLANNRQDIPAMRLYATRLAELFPDEASYEALLSRLPDPAP